MGWGRVGSRTPYFTRTYRRCVPGLESKSSSAAQSSKTHFSSHTDLSWWCHLFRGERRTRFYFRIFAHDHQDVRIQSVFFWMPSLSLPPLMYSCGMVTQLTRLPSYSQYLPMLSQLSSSQSPPGYPTASSPADFSSSSQARWAEPDICKYFFFNILRSKLLCCGRPVNADDPILYCRSRNIDIDHSTGYCSLSHTIATCSTLRRFVLSAARTRRSDLSLHGVSALLRPPHRPFPPAV